MALDVIVRISQTAIAGKVGFGMPLILTTKLTAASAVPYTVCESLEDVKTACGASSEAAKAAALIFAQTNKPSKIAVYGSTAAGTAAIAEVISKEWRQLILIKGDGDTTTDAAIATYIEGTNKLYFITVAATTGLANLSTFSRTIAFFYNLTTTVEETEVPVQPYAVAALVGETAGRTVGSFTYKNLIIKGLTPLDLSDNQLGEIHSGGALTVANSILMNQISRYGSPQHIAAFSIMMKVSSLAVMPIFGLGQGMQPIVGYCWGAGLYQRARKTIELALVAAFAITATAEVFLLAFPQVFARAFTDDAEVIRLTVWGVRILQSTFAIVGFQVIGTVVFQALGFAGPALFLSMSRQVIFFIPALLVLPRFFGVAGVFASYPVADVAACCVTLGFLLFYRKRFRALEQNSPAV